ncbi:hypothetical protein ERM46_10905 [Clostridioides difficile]|nr:hypothetical protein [Clostridioides difficile]EGT3731086.1 hypothetical protein [Clostridioides difficile]EGT3772721.1 hypothetical protein [Clostridioides difficile]EGT3805979.1 hypothetical protein [Clostridioides difficile]EGT3881206.1 hypothetical protein [Clostridioides difficile]
MAFKYGNSHSYAFSITFFLAKIIITYIYIKKDLVSVLSLLKYNLFSKSIYFFILYLCYN